MDQLACAVGGFAAMDLADPANPLVERVCSPLAQHGFCLYVVNTGGSHADLTGQYAAVREEMQSVAACLGYQALRQIPEGEFWAQIGRLHLQVSDRAICRAIHFFGAGPAHRADDPDSRADNGIRPLFPAAFAKCLAGWAAGGTGHFPGAGAV